MKKSKTKSPSANLIRALTVHGALIPTTRAERVDPTTKNTEGRLSLLGYGMPNRKRLLGSTDQHVDLVAEDDRDGGYYHVYEFDIPAAFAR